MRNAERMTKDDMGGWCLEGLEEKSDGQRWIWGHCDGGQELWSQQLLLLSTRMVIIITNLSLDYSEMTTQ